MNQPVPTVSDPCTEEEVLASFQALPTEDDLPYDDGEPMETPRHRDQMNLLIDSLKIHWSERTGYFVGGNMFLHYDPTNARRSRGPDVFLVLNVADRERKSWVVWQEGMRFPNLIVELLSDSTRHIDKGEKKDLYAQLFHTAEYYLYDPYSHEFVGYRLQGISYQEVAPDAEGKIYSAVTDLYLGIRDGWLRWLTPDGHLVLSPQERAEQAQQLAEAERQRAEHAQQQAEHAQQQAEHAQQQAEHAQQQAEHAQQQAEAERVRAEQAEQRLEAYRQRFGNLE